MAVTSPNKREERARQTREAITEAAEKLFVEKGFAATAVSEVAKAAGVTKSLIHHHFGSKEALWIAIRDRFMETVNSFVSERLSQDPAPWDAERFQRAFVDFNKFIEHNNAMFRMQVWLYAEQRRQLATAPALVQSIMANVSTAQKNGLIRDDISPEMILAIFWVMIENWHMTKAFLGMRLGLDFETREMDEVYLAATQKIFTEGILPHPAKKKN